MQLLLRDTVCGHWLTVQSHVDYTFSLEKGNYNSFGSVLVYLPDRRSPYKLFESIAMTIAVSADDETHGDHQYELHADGRFWMVQGVTRGVLGFDISERKHLLQFCLVPLKSGCLSLPVFRMGNGDSGWQFNVKICDVKIDGAPVRAKTFVIPKK